jgi:hypothetical protein
LELADPLLNKLDDAHSDRHIQILLAELAHHGTVKRQNRCFGSASAISKPAMARLMQRFPIC